MSKVIKNCLYFFSLISIMGFIGCNKGPNFKIYQYPAPVVKSISPGSGYAGSTLTISGSNFGNAAAAVSVWIGGAPVLSIKSCIDTQLVVQVPANAVSGKVTLKVWTHTLDSVGKFTVLPPPVIAAVVSQSPLGTNIAAQGDEVWIKGSGFGSNKANINVSFNGTDAASIISVVDSLIKVITPANYATGALMVTVNGFQITGPVILNPDVKGDISAFYLKNYMQPFVGIVTGDNSRWRTPVGWVVTAPIMNHSGANNLPAGGLDNNHPPLMMAFEAGWGGAPDIVNGKMYQTMTLPPGNYTFSVGMSNNDFNTNVYLAAAAGTTLPDAANINTAIGSVQLISDGQYYNGATGKTFSFNFTLSQKTQVSLGFIVNMSAYHYLNMTWVKLVNN